MLSLVTTIVIIDDRDGGEQMRYLSVTEIAKNGMFQSAA